MKYRDTKRFVIIERCNDCGAEIREASDSSRDDVCGECWERRKWLVQHMTELPLDKVQKIQRAMAAKRGTAKRQIKALQVVKR